MKTEIQTICSSKLKLATLAAIIVLPLIYGALYLWAFWDPYAKLKNIPVAVVNNDKCVIRENKDICLGKELVEKLSKNPALDWHFVSSDEAEKGLDDKEFYSILYIPSDLSSQVSSVDENFPRSAHLIIKTRQASNFMVSKFVDTAVGKIKASLNENIAEEYFHSIFIETRDSGKDLQRAVDGSNKIQSGLQDASFGTKSLNTGLQSAYNGSKILKNGLSEFANGSDDFYGGFVTVQQGKNVSFLQGVNDLATGSANLADGLSTLSSSVATFQIGIAQIATSSSTLLVSSQLISEGLNQSVAGINSSTLALDNASSLLATYLTNHPEATASVELQKAIAVISDTNSGLKNVATGTSQLAVKQQQFNYGLSLANNGLLNLNAGIRQIADGVKNLSNGAQKIADGANTARDGSQNLADGAKKIRDNLYKLKDGSENLVSGIEKLNQGSLNLLSGLNDISNGVFTLRDKLDSAAKTIFGKTDPSKTEKQAIVMAAAVDVADQSVNLVANNGTGFAPYFVPLALWVGAMAIFFLIDPELKGSFNLVKIFDKIFIVAVIGLLQAAILDLVLVKVLGLLVLSFKKLFVFSVLMSWSFIAIQYFLTMLLADAGKFVSILLLMLQLTSSAGSYPYETLPAFFQTINPFLPMTYCVTALREIISGGNWLLVSKQIWVLCLLCFVFMLMIIIKYLFQSSKKLNNNYD